MWSWVFWRDRKSFSFHGSFTLCWATWPSFSLPHSDSCIFMFCRTLVTLGLNIVGKKQIRHFKGDTLYFILLKLKMIKKKKSESSWESNVVGQGEHAVLENRQLFEEISLVLVSLGSAAAIQFKCWFIEFHLSGFQFGVMWCRCSIREFHCHGFQRGGCLGESAASETFSALCQGTSLREMQSF